MRRGHSRSKGWRNAPNHMDATMAVLTPVVTPYVPTPVSFIIPMTPPPRVAPAAASSQTEKGQDASSSRRRGEGWRRGEENGPLMRTPLLARERSGETGQRREGVGVEGSGSDVEEEEDDMSWMDGGEEMVDRSAQRSRSERSLNFCLEPSRTCRQADTTARPLLSACCKLSGTRDQGD